jgi:hypothetical protein
VLRQPDCLFAGIHNGDTVSHLAHPTLVGTVIGKKYVIDVLLWEVKWESGKTSGFYYECNLVKK